MNKSGPPTPLAQTEYEAIEQAMMETSRGRWFLAEFAERNRRKDTHILLEAIHKLEATVQKPKAAESIEQVQSNLLEMSEAINRTRKEIASLKLPDEDDNKFMGATEELDAIIRATEKATHSILHAAEDIQETIWRLREDGASEAPCARIDTQITDIYTACSFQDITGQRTHKVVQVLRYIESRINAMISIWGIEGSGVDRRDVMRDARPDAHLLHGPQLDGRGLRQNDVDDVLIKIQKEIEAQRPVAPQNPVYHETIEEPALLITDQPVTVEAIQNIDLNTGSPQSELQAQLREADATSLLASETQDLAVYEHTSPALEDIEVSLEPLNDQTPERSEQNHSISQNSENVDDTAVTEAAFAILGIPLITPEVLEADFARVAALAPDPIDIEPLIDGPTLSAPLQDVLDLPQEQETHDFLNAVDTALEDQAGLELGSEIVANHSLAEVDPIEKINTETNEYTDQKNQTQETNATQLTSLASASETGLENIPDVVTETFIANENISLENSNFQNILNIPSDARTTASSFSTGTSQNAPHNQIEFERISDIENRIAHLQQTGIHDTGQMLQEINRLTDDLRLALQSLKNLTLSSAQTGAEQSAETDPHYETDSDMDSGIDINVMEAQTHRSASIAALNPMDLEDLQEQDGEHKESSSESAADQTSSEPQTNPEEEPSFQTSTAQAVALEQESASVSNFSEPFPSEERMIKTSQEASQTLQPGLQTPQDAEDLFFKSDDDVNPAGDKIGGDVLTAEQFERPEPHSLKTLNTTSKTVLFD